MGFRTLLFTYIFGGLTFIPLLLIAVLAPAWYLLPKTEGSEGKDAEHEEHEELKGRDESAAEKQSQDSSRDLPGDAVGANLTCAVLRRYDLQAALTAIGSKATASTNGNGDHSSDAAGNDSPSVYQSMYRSVFTGNKANNSTSSLLQHADTDSPGVRRKPAPANVLYIVLRHGHLMVYDSPAQVEVKHVISLANHSVSLQSGTVDEKDMDERMIPESDLFIKRTAIVLTPVELPGGALQQASTAPAKPFYLFSATNIEKEAFYHALLASRSYPPEPRPLDVEALIKLQSTLHASSMTSEARALNAIIGRMFLAIHRTDAMNDFVRFKIEKKLARIQKPTFIPSLRIQSLNLGDAGPVFSNLKMRDLNISGDMTISADMKYNGGLSITFLAVARLDLGPRFKARTVDLVLKTTIKRISGSMLLHIKPPPSNRTWFCFENVPEMEIRVEPVVSERKITYGFVLRAIEERVRTAIAEGLVKPNWDDIPFPFADTRGSHARGGLWRHDGEPDNAQAAGPTRAAAGLAEKNASVPELLPGTNVAASTGLQKSATMPVGESQLRRRTMDSSETEAELATSPDRSRPKALRSPSMSSPTPSVAIDGLNVEPVRSDDASLRTAPTTNRRLWRSRGAQSTQPQPRDALEELRDLRDRTEKTISTMRDGNVSDFHDGENNTPSTPAETEASSTYSRRPSDSSISATAARTFSMQSADSERSPASSFSSSQSSHQTQSKKANVLAATVAATNAARNWGWNTLQRNKNVFPRNGAKPEATGVGVGVGSDQPMGRGQPLPPPGVPLPGPQQKTLWGNMKRKPVPNLPPRRPAAGTTTERIKDESVARESEEFEPWQENSGPVDFASESPSEAHLSSAQLSAKSSEGELLMVPNDKPAELVRKSSWEGSKIPVKAGKVPPPLPRRPSPVARSTHSSASTSRTETGGGTGSLQVPESQVDAVAAENATSELAHGAGDIPTMVDESEGVEADVGPDRVDEDDASSRRSGLEVGDEARRASKSSDNEADQDKARRAWKASMNSKTGLNEKNVAATTEKFTRGEDVNEEDFERDGEIIGGIKEDARSNLDLLTESMVKANQDSAVSLGKEDAASADLSTTAESLKPQAQSEEDAMAERIRSRIQHHTLAANGRQNGSSN